jgi:hypothetical protein
MCAPHFDHTRYLRQDHEIYGRFSQTDVSMEDGPLTFASTEAETEPEPEPETQADADDADGVEEGVALGEDGEAAEKIQSLMTAAQEKLAKKDFKEALRQISQASEEAENRVKVEALAAIESSDLFSVHMDDKLAHAEKKPEFRRFFSESSKLMEKALNQANKFDIFATVMEDTSVEEQKDDVQEYCTFYDDLCQERTVTDLHWSPRANDPLLLATYSSRRDKTMSSQEPDGLALIWSFHLQDRPEQIFECQSSVMTVRDAAAPPPLISARPRQAIYEADMWWCGVAGHFRHIHPPSSDWRHSVWTNCCVGSARGRN